MDAEEKQTVLGGIAMSMIQLKGGAKYFLKRIEKFEYPTTYRYPWDVQVDYLSSAGYKPWSCDNFCPHSNSCEHQKNMILTASKAVSKKKKENKNK